MQALAASNYRRSRAIDENDSHLRSLLTYRSTIALSSPRHSRLRHSAAAGAIPAASVGVVVATPPKVVRQRSVAKKYAARLVLGLRWHAPCFMMWVRGNDAAPQAGVITMLFPDWFSPDWSDLPAYTVHWFLDGAAYLCATAQHHNMWSQAPSYQQHA